MVRTHRRAEFGAEPEAVGRARRFVRTALEAWDIGDPSDVAALLTSEVVTNAIRHGQSACGVDVDATDDRLEVSVSDGSRQMPVLGRPSLDRSGGRGLLLVDALAAEWGTRTVQGGKAVWFRLPVAAPGQPGVPNGLQRYAPP